MPEEQAEPEDTAMPARSKPITAVSAFRPGTVKSVVFGNRGTVVGEYDHVRGLPQAVLQPVSAGLRARTASLSSAAIAASHGGAKAGNAGDILGSRPSAQFLAAAAQQRLQAPQALGQHDRADALGAADLVRRKRHADRLQSH